MKQFFDDVADSHVGPLWDDLHQEDIRCVVLDPEHCGIDSGPGWGGYCGFLRGPKIREEVDCLCNLIQCGGGQRN